MDPTIDSGAWYHDGKYQENEYRQENAAIDKCTTWLATWALFAWPWHNVVMHDRLSRECIPAPSSDTLRLSVSRNLTSNSILVFLFIPCSLPWHRHDYKRMPLEPLYWDDKHSSWSAIRDSKVSCDHTCVCVREIVCERNEYAKKHTLNRLSWSTFFIATSSPVRNNFAWYTTPNDPFPATL